MIAETRATSTETRLRRGLLWLGALTTFGLALELIAEGHWKGAQLIAWGALALAAVALALLIGQPPSWRIRVARALAVLVVTSAALGIWQHILGNHEAGPLDFRYAQTWDGMSALAQWWTAARKGVGPSPPLAPGALALVGGCVLLASSRLPAQEDPGTRDRVPD